MKTVKLKKSIENLPFREWITGDQEIYAYHDGSKVRIINGICPHYFGELYLDNKQNKIVCNFHHLKFCPKNLTGNHESYKKLREYKIKSLNPIIIEF